MAAQWPVPVDDTAQLGSDARGLVKRKIGLPKRPGGCQWGIPAAVLKCFVGLNLNATNPDDLKGMSSCQWFRVDGEWSDEVTKLPKTLADAQIARWQSEYRRDSTDLGAEDPNTLSIAGNLWLRPSMTKANTPTLSGSSARCRSTGV